jgi:hypothetical protein
MKKFILSLALALPLAADAASHQDMSFLNVQSLQVSNVAAITNHIMYPLMTNIIGTTWTNNSGTLVTVTNAGNTAMLVKDVPLWSDQNGRTPILQIQSVPGSLTNYANISPATISGKILGGAAANSAVTFVFTPIWKDPRNTEGIPFIATTHDWSFAVTGASGTVTFATNAPIYLWPGAWGMRVRSIVNADTDFTGNVWIQELDLSGFKP